MFGDTPEFQVQEQIVLSKYEGEPLPENEIERLHILNGEVIKVEQIENGEVVSTSVPEGV